MTPNQSHVAGLELAMNEMAEHSPAACALAHYHLPPLIDQAKSAPAEPVSREVVEYQQLSRWGCWDRIEKDVFDLGVLGHTPERFRALYTAPPSPDAELVELLRLCRNDFAGVGMTHNLIGRIDAKLASLK